MSIQLDFSGEIVLVTGGATGLGFAIARAFGLRGATVALNDLTEDQRQVIQMRFMGDMSIQEVATKLGRTEGSVKALQHRGLQSLARRLQPAVAYP